MASEPPGEDVRLHGRAERDDLVGIELGVGLLAAGAELEELIGERADGGMRVEPPTRTTSSICSGVMPASFSA